MKKKIIILNGTNGIIGSQLYKNLRSNYKIVRISNRKSKNKNINFLDYNKSIELVKFFCKFKEVHAFLYCGWGDVYSPFSKNHLSENLRFAKNSLKAYFHSGHSNFIFFGSTSEYGDLKGNILEKHSHKGVLRSYDKSKKLFSKFGFLTSSKKKKKFIHLRISNVLSPYQKKNSLISYLHQNKKKSEIRLSSLDYYKDYIFIDDLVNGIKKIIENSNVSEIINLASSRSILAKKFTTKYFDRLGGKKHSLLFQKDIKCTYGRKNKYFKIDISKLKKKYKFKPKTALNDAIVKTIKSYKVIN